MKSHLKNAHLPSKDLECPLCHKLFKAVNNLKQHLLLHSEERSYVCDFEGCDKSFKQKPGLDQHIRVVHNANESFCKSCRKRVPNLKKHLSDIHPTLSAKRKTETQKGGNVAKKRRQGLLTEVNEFDSESSSDDDVSGTWEYSSDDDGDDEYAALFASDLV